MTVTRLLWVAIAVYGGFVAWTGHRDLTARYTVQGLFRTYAHAYEDPDGHVIDPRPGALDAEIRRRYGAGEAALGPTATKGPGEGLKPRVVGVGGARWLVVGFFGRRPVVFDPARGVVLLRRGVLPETAPAVELEDASEAPW